MTEDEAKHWLDAQGWWQGAAGDKLRTYASLLLDEADRQNLISAASRETMWSRHIVDSAQLLPLAPEGQGRGLWVDLGTGAGLPGLVIACLREAPVLLVEVRPLRVAFLRHCVDILELDHVTVTGEKVERVILDQPAAIISARAYAPLDRLVASATHLADPSTTWLLPKGRNAEKELEILKADWQAVFHVEQSITDADSAIVTLNRLEKRKQSLSKPRKSSGARRRATWKAKQPS